MIIKYIRTKKGKGSAQSTKADGLINYLFGPGSANEHSDPYVVASSGGVWMPNWWNERDESERPIHRTDKEYLQEIKDYLNQNTPKDISKTSRHIKHFVIAARPEEEPYGHWEWNQIAHEFAKYIGFDIEEDCTKNVNWVAVNHGKNAAGADHIHLVVNTIRDDGSRWSDSNIAYRCKDAERHIENEFPWVAKVKGRQYDRSKKGYTKQEWEEYARRVCKEKYDSEHGEGYWDKLEESNKNYLMRSTKEYELPRRELERKVRECAGAAITEDDFVRRLRGQGVLLKPRFDKNNPNEVIGYSVALKKKNTELRFNERQYWYSGSKLAHDLTIKRLREEWQNIPDVSERQTGETVGDEVYKTPSKAADEWRAAQKHRPIVWGEDGTQTSVNAQQILRVNDNLKQFATKLQEAITSGEAKNMTRLSRYLSAAFSGMARQYDNEDGMFARVADEIARTASTQKNARYRGKVNLEYEAIKGAIRIIAADTNEYVALKILVQTLIEIAQIHLENRRLEGELYEARREWSLLHEQIETQTKLMRNIALEETGVKISQDILDDEEKREEMRFFENDTGWVSIFGDDDNEELDNHPLWEERPDISKLPPTQHTKIFNSLEPGSNDNKNKPTL